MARLYNGDESPNRCVYCYNSFKRIRCPVPIQPTQTIVGATNVNPIANEEYRLCQRTA
ncbi:MAG: hypothetical protein RIM23_10960 [Coleofasciculus sp. G3-WIS-01]|uniref:hypothetical protein n=1 Tax=Coleofasciculus sp. G3-WIS-01 TaxID=3069528 RepID=UPI0032FC820C